MTQNQTAPDLVNRPLWNRPVFARLLARLLGLVPIVGILLVACQSSTDTVATAPSTSAPGAAIPGGDATGVPDGSVSTDIPTVAPTDVTWQLVGQEAVPVSRTAGPLRISGGTASGYAHTPTGALIAVAQLEIRAAREAGRTSWEPTLIQQFVPSTDRDKLLATLRSLPPAQQANPGELPQISGFRFISYTPDTAVVGLVLRPTSAQYTITTLTVLWRDGDWRMVTPPDGTWLALTQPLLNMSGVVAWGAR